MRHQTKSGMAASANEPSVIQATSGLETSWHYVTIGYGGGQLGLLVETDDEDAARREAQELCADFDSQAMILSVTKVVLQ